MRETDTGLVCKKGINPITMLDRGTTAWGSVGPASLGPAVYPSSKPGLQLSEDVSPSHTSRMPT